MRVPVLAALLAPALLVAAEDVVLLTNGQRLRGTIDTSVEPKPGTVAIRMEEGLVRIRADLVAAIDESFASRRAKVRPDDAEGLHALARWCLAKGLRAEALELLTQLGKLAGCPLEARALFARMVDEASPEQALPLYQLYRARGGTDAAVLARLKQLEDALAAFTGTTAGAPAAQPATVSNGFEDRGWDTESQQWSNPGKVETVNVSQGEAVNQVLSLAYSGGDKDKTAIKRALRGIAAGPNSELRFFVANRGKDALRLAVALKTGNYIYHESKMVLVKASEDWQEVRIPLSSKDWKSQASNWAHTIPVADIGDVKELLFLVYNARSDGTLLIDAVEFSQPKDL